MPARFQRFRTTIWIYIATIGGSMVLFAIALVLVGTDIATQSVMIADTKAAQVRQTSIIDGFADLKTDSVMAESYESKLKQLLPPEDELINFSKYIGDRARVYSVGVSVGFQGEPARGDKTHPGTVHFTLSVEGSLPQVRDFVSDISERNTRFLVSLGGFELNALGGEKYRMNFSGQTFFRSIQ